MEARLSQALITIAPVIHSKAMQLCIASVVSVNTTQCTFFSNTTIPLMCDGGVGALGGI